MGGFILAAGAYFTEYDASREFRALSTTHGGFLWFGDDFLANDPRACRNKLIKTFKIVL